MRHIAVDPGSTHMGQKKFIKELVERTAQAGADSIKFQLFPNTKEYTAGGNIYLSDDLFRLAFSHGEKCGIEVTASVFGPREADFISGFDVPYVKFAYSQRNNLRAIEGFLNRGSKVVVSTDVMTAHMLPKHHNLVKLYVYTLNGEAVYPCDVALNFEGKFPPFDGFSDHTIGYGQACEAVRFGAKWIEKHVTLGYVETDCPDTRFAMHIDALAQFVAMVMDEPAG